MRETIKADYCIEIDFDKNSEDPGRIFRTMSSLIETFEDIDAILVDSIDSKIEASIMLEDIEASSLKTWLVNILKATDDEGIKNIDWKPLVGKYLVKGKYILIKFLEGKTKITNKSELLEIRDKLLECAEETGVKQIPAYCPITPANVISGIGKISDSLANLSKKDSAKYISESGEVNFNIEFNFVPGDMEDLITKEVIESSAQMILKVKKPDYLGDSRWEFIYDNHIIPVKFIDKEWLEKFQSRNIDVRPGDSLRADVKIKVKYGYDNEVVGKHYEIIKVIDVLKFNEENLILDI